MWDMAHPSQDLGKSPARGLPIGKHRGAQVSRHGAITSESLRAWVGFPHVRVKV